MTGEIHVVPVADLREHVEDERCWCAPTRDAEVPSVLVHHAADMREHAEPDNAAPERARA